jgi:predicted nucleic acid-binding protein
VSLALVDTSTWGRRAQTAVRDALVEAIDANRVVMVQPVKLELLRSARDPDEWRALAFEYGTLEQVSLTDDIARRAVVVQGSLARRGHHRAPSPVDLLAAAAAEAIGAEVWHCDRHFELIAEVTGQPVRRVGR